MIHSDYKPRRRYKHLSENAIDVPSMHGRTGSAVQDAHLAVCLECTQRVMATRDFIRIFRLAAASVLTGRSRSSETH